MRDDGDIPIFCEVLCNSSISSMSSIVYELCANVWFFFDIPLIFVVK